jgi:anti-anti-sigma factor
MLSETERLDSGVWLVTLEGELDLSSVAGLERALGAFEHEHAADVMLVLESVPFVDSTAMGVMIRTSRRLWERGGSLSIVRPRGHPARLLDRIGVDRLLPVFETTTAALASIARYQEHGSPRELTSASRASRSKRKPAR